MDSVLREGWLDFQDNSRALFNACFTEKNVYMVCFSGNQAYFIFSDCFIGNSSNMCIMLTIFSVINN